jgi:hypothetical protein
MCLSPGGVSGRCDQCTGGRRPVPAALPSSSPTFFCLFRALHTQLHNVQRLGLPKCREMLFCYLLHRIRPSFRHPPTFSPHLAHVRRPKTAPFLPRPIAPDSPHVGGIRSAGTAAYSFDPSHKIFHKAPARRPPQPSPPSALAANRDEVRSPRVCGRGGIVVSEKPAVVVACFAVGVSEECAFLSVQTLVDRISIALVGAPTSHREVSFAQAGGTF